MCAHAAPAIWIVQNEGVAANEAAVIAVNNVRAKMAREAAAAAVAAAANVQ